MNLTEATSKFLFDSGIVRTPVSRRSYRSVLSYLNSTFPVADINDYTTKTLTSFCLLDGRSHATVAARRTAVRSLFEWCHYMKYCKTNPAADLKFTVRSTGNKPVVVNNWLTEQQIGEMLRACDTDDIIGQRARVVLLIGFMTGLRRFEIAALTWSDFSEDMSRLKLIGKGEKLAVLGVPPQVREALLEWRKLAPATAVAVVPRFAGGGNIALDTIRWNEPVNGATIHEIIKGISRKSGVAMRPHDMRRSFAGILEERGVPVTDISRALRHANVGITSTYLDKNPAKAAALADVFMLDL